MTTLNVVIGMEEKKIIHLPNNSDQPSSKEAITRAINEAIENDNLRSLKKLVAKTHYADLADYINFANYEQRLAVIKFIDQSTDPLILLEFEPEVLKSLIPILGFEKFAKIANNLETEESVSLLHDLPQELQDKTLDFFPPNERRLVLKALSYPKNSAGLLMQISYVSIEENKPTAKEGTAEKGFDFASRSPAVSEVTHEEMKRVPANIASKSSEHSTPYSYIGPMIFLLALPLALWIVVSKKMKGNEGNEKVDYYSKTVQFKPYKTEYQETDIDDEDQNYPKAS